MSAVVRPWPESSSWAQCQKLFCAHLVFTVVLQVISADLPFQQAHSKFNRSSKKFVSAVVKPLIVSPTQTPRLLVSVRNSDEARAAIAGGCDILDIKEPHRGSLGMADPDVTAQIIETTRNLDRSLPVSAALGEVVDWSIGPNGISAVPSCFEDCTFLKIGCAGLRSQPEWRTELSETRQAVTSSLSNPPSWVAVAYADWEAADAPKVSDVVRAALHDKCCGVLIDTFTKSNRWLLDWITLNELHAIADQVHSHGLFLALAGSLNAADLPRLKPVDVDILAIRGAACLQGQRQSEISQAAVRAFQQRISAIWPLAPASSGKTA
ncbi:MAG: hypothetical protein JWM11_1669 [Planctomycetaceae bacterium]|nr:hypothetical protein [Planctomycetaceae bacterium]